MCWQEITDEFNAQCPTGALRSVVSLQKWYNKKKTEELWPKTEVFGKTGGGPLNNDEDNNENEFNDEANPVL